MNGHDSLERELTVWMADVAAPRVPDYTNDIVRMTAGLGQRPRWAFPERWLPMTVDTLQREVTNIVHATGVEHRHDVRMVQTPSCLGLTHESLFDTFMPD